MLIKYADGVALVGCLKDFQSLNTYFNFVNFKSQIGSYMQLNISKTKEMRFKYLGTEIDSQFSFDKHSDSVFKKA